MLNTRNSRPHCLFIFALIGSTFWLSARPVLAAPVELNRQVLLSDGKPAANARVELWIFDGTTTNVKEHKSLTLPADGWLRTAVDLPITPADSVIDDHMGRRGMYYRHYMVIDAPGSPVAIVRIPERRPYSTADYKPEGWDKPVTLSGGGIVDGRTLAGEKPVPNATAAVMSLNGFLLNSADGKVSNPSLQAKSGADGGFIFRPFRLVHDGHPHDEPSAMCSVFASATVDGVRLVGTSVETSPMPVGRPLDPRLSAIIGLGGTWTVRGRVTDETTGKGVAGASVQIAALSPWPLPTALTNARGEWEIGGIPPNFKMVAAATHPNTSIGHAAVGDGLSRIDDAARQPRLFENVEIRVKPVALVEGRIEEEGTGKIPAWRLPDRALSSELLVRYDWGEKVGNDNVGNGLARATPGEEGRFSIKLPLGEHTLGLSVPGYEPVERRTVNVPASGLKDVVLKVRKRPAFVIQLGHPRLKEMKNLGIAVISDREYAGEFVKDGFWYHSAKNWGDTLKIKVQQGAGREIKTLVETTLTAAPEPWPQVINLPGE